MLSLTTMPAGGLLVTQRFCHQDVVASGQRRGGRSSFLSRARARSTSSVKRRSNLAGSPALSGPVGRGDQALVDAFSQALIITNPDARRDFDERLQGV